MLQTRQKDPSIQASAQDKVSSGKPYHIANYVTCDRFSNAHRSYLATISKVVEHRFFMRQLKTKNGRKQRRNKLKSPSKIIHDH